MHIISYCTHIVLYAECISHSLSASRTLRESALASRALCRVVVVVSYPKDFVAVPAGTLPVAALALRGADPSLCFATADSFNTTLGVALCVVPGRLGRWRRHARTWWANLRARSSRAILLCSTPPRSWASLARRRCALPGFSFLLMA